MASVCYVCKTEKTNRCKCATIKFHTYVKEKAKTSASNGIVDSDKPFFQPLKDIHLYSSDFKFDLAQRGNITYVNALTIIAIFILLIACFNFINLATAKSLQRAKEVVSAKQ
jgi:putative ABC transport system permease protein